MIIPAGMMSNPKTRNEGNTIHIKSPRYELPCAKNIDITNRNPIINKLTIEIIAPINEVQL
jgi:hypothetical protein